MLTDLWDISDLFDDDAPSTARDCVSDCGEPEFLRCEAAWVSTYPAGRVCRHRGCDTVLSIYNPTRYCGAHQPEADMVYLGHTFHLCRGCGDVITDKSKSGFCAVCARKAKASRSLRRDGRPDAVQRAQARAAS